MKNIKKICQILILVIAFILIGTVKSKAGTLKLNNLDFETKIDTDGNMHVTETWDISISQTNTLYKTFKTDSSKYSEINNVKVREITSGQNREFQDNGEWAYHAPKDYYYGTKNSDGYFEIGWGVGLDNSRATRKYEITYTVKDVITKYNDNAELYWQFIGDEFEISATKVTGTIYLPSKVANIDDIKVWGHTEDLNGTIYATDLDKVEFELNNYVSGKYVEIRTLFPTELITNSEKIKNKEILQTAIKEETEWADKANEKREKEIQNKKIISIIKLIVSVILNIILILVYVKKANKYKKYLKTLNKYKPASEQKYFRDLPDENATPGEVVKILNLRINEYSSDSFGKIFSATMLNLALKGYISLSQDKKTTTISILKESNEELKEDEKLIFDFIKLGISGRESITVKELEKYIQNHAIIVENLLKDTYNEAYKQLITEKIIDEEKDTEYKKYKMREISYICATIFIFFFTIRLFIIPIIIFIINSVLCRKISNEINVLTQKGVDTQEQWNGLKRYMKDFSMLDKREVPELIIWEKYLVYATTFGIADKVIKQLKIVYPDFDEIMSTNSTSFTYMNIMTNINFSKSFSNAISSSITTATSAYSSGTGGGGGFSGGGGFGGGRRRRWPEDNIKIK